MIVMEEYLTPEEVAQKLKLHPSTIMRLLRTGQIPGYKVVGSWRINPTELDAWMEQRKNKRTEKD